MQIYTPDTCVRFEELSPETQEKLIKTIAEEEGCTERFFAPPFEAFANELTDVLKCCGSPSGQYYVLRKIIRRLYLLAEKYPWNDKCDMLVEFFDQMNPSSLVYQTALYMEDDDDDF